MSSKYVSSKEKYKDNINSAFSLLFVGIIGLVFIILLNLKIIPLNIPKTTLLLATIVLGSVFVIFIIMGIKSYLDGKKYQSNISAEEDSQLDIALFITEHLSKENIDNQIENIDELTEEELYIVRTEYIADIIHKNFEDADEKLVESIIDDIYDKIF